MTQTQYLRSLSGHWLFALRRRFELLPLSTFVPLFEGLRGPWTRMDRPSLFLLTHCKNLIPFLSPVQQWSTVWR